MFVTKPWNIASLWLRRGGSGEVSDDGGSVGCAAHGSRRADPRL